VLSNKTGSELNDVLIFTNVDCRYSIPAGKRQLDAAATMALPFLGMDGGDVATLTSAYQARDEALRAYYNTPKPGVFYARTWKSNEQLELAIMPLGEFLHTARTMTIDVVDPATARHYEVDVAAVHRQIQSQIEKEQREMIRKQEAQARKQRKAMEKEVRRLGW
jgi:hypothetical protein